MIKHYASKWDSCGTVLYITEVMQGNDSEKNKFKNLSKSRFGAQMNTDNNPEERAELKTKNNISETLGIKGGRRDTEVQQ